MRLPARASKALLPRLTTADPGPQLDLFYSALGFATRPAARGPPGGPSELTRLAAYLRGTPAPPAAKGSLTVAQLHLLFASFLAYHGLPLPETLPSPVAAVVGGGDEALPTLVAAATATLTNANAALRGALLPHGSARYVQRVVLGPHYVEMF